MIKVINHQIRLKTTYPDPNCRIRAGLFGTRYVCYFRVPFRRLEWHEEVIQL